MSSAGDIEIWNSAVQAYDNGFPLEAIEIFSAMATISSKISFNVGCAYYALDDVANALKNFKEAVNKDSHLAIGYYMSGICLYKSQSYSAAVKQFEETIKSMRGNRMVDYKQIGLKYQLFECEVLVNQAVVLSKLGERDEAESMLLKAAQAKVEKKHEKIEESLSILKLGHDLQMILPPRGTVFRPSAHAVKNVKKKDYLGQAKVLYSADPKDNKSGFSGLLLVQESRNDLLSDIRKPGRKETLRKISKPSQQTLPNSKLGKIVDSSPPHKPLPCSPTEDRKKRAETWNSKPSKPLPKSPIPNLPARPPNSAILVENLNKGMWTGKRSENSAFQENISSSMHNQVKAKNDSQGGQFRRPNKPLPNSPQTASTKSGLHVSPANKESHYVSMDVEFNFSAKIKVDDKISYEDLLEVIHQISLPRDLCVNYIDSLGKQKRLTDVALDHILQGSIDNAKLVCFENNYPKPSN